MRLLSAGLVSKCLVGPRIVTGLIIISYIAHECNYNCQNYIFLCEKRGPFCLLSSWEIRVKGTFTHIGALYSLADIIIDF